MDRFAFSRLAARRFSEMGFESDISATGPSLAVDFGEFRMLWRNLLKIRGIFSLAGRESPTSSNLVKEDESATAFPGIIPERRFGNWHD